MAKKPKMTKLKMEKLREQRKILKERQREERRSAILKAAAIINCYRHGSQTNLAEKLGMTRQALHKAIRMGSLSPARAARVEELCGGQVKAREMASRVPH